MQMTLHLRLVPLDKCLAHAHSLLHLTVSCQLIRFSRHSIAYAL